MNKKVRIARIARFHRSMSGEGLELLSSLKACGATDNPFLFVNPWPGMGDIFLIAKHLPEYLCEHGIEDYLFVVPSEAAYQAASLYQEIPVKKISMSEMNLLVRFICFTGEGMTSSKIMHHHLKTLPFNVALSWQGIEDTNMKTTLIEDVMKVSGNGPIFKPSFQDDPGLIQSVFKDKSFYAGNTVIISPYANSNKAIIDYQFWDAIVASLKEEGFDIATNCTGDEQPLRNTECLRFPLNMARPVLENAGYFIGWRSGFCDVVGMAKCKKVVLYDDSKWIGLCKPCHYYNLRDIGLSQDAFEINVTDSNKERVISTISEYLQGYTS